VNMCNYGSVSSWCIIRTQIYDFSEDEASVSHEVYISPYKDCVRLNKLFVRLRCKLSPLISC
jgi:hypothetical protein